MYFISEKKIIIEIIFFFKLQFCYYNIYFAYVLIFVNYFLATLSTLVGCTYIQRKIKICNIREIENLVID